MTNWGAIAALEAKKREYMDCPHGASNKACCVFCITNTEPPANVTPTPEETLVELADLRAIVKKMPMTASVGANGAFARCYDALAASQKHVRELERRERLLRKAAHLFIRAVEFRGDEAESGDVGDIYSEAKGLVRDVSEPPGEEGG